MTRKPVTPNVRVGVFAALALLATVATLRIEKRGREPPPSSTPCFGRSYCYIGRHYDPEYVGAFPDLVGHAIVPDVLLHAHFAALGSTFYTCRSPQSCRR